MPSGRSSLHAITRSYGLDGDSVDDELVDEHHHEDEAEPMTIEDTTDLYYLCEKDTPEQVEGEMEATWDLCLESQVYKTCLSIRKHVYTNTMPQLRDKKKQALIDESKAPRDRNDWILDPKHVYRRSILRKKMPQWTNSTEKMERWSRPIWEPKRLRRAWEPPVSEEDMWAFPKAEFADGGEIAKEFREFMIDPKNIGQNLRRKNNLSALGLDGIGHLMMKLGGIPMLKFLAHLFEACTVCGKVPRTWKRSRTVFLYKKGDKELPENWRPITITSCVYRIFTSMISEFLQQKIHKTGRRKIFSNSQKGFVAGVQGCMEHDSRNDCTC
jgi:hypothetical protein